MSTRSKHKELMSDQLVRADSVDSWTLFTRAGGIGSSASKISEVIGAGNFIEVNDRKFQGSSIVMLRKSDYEKLIINSRTSFRIKKLLVMLSETIFRFKRYEISKDAESELRVIETSLSLGLELAQDVRPLYPNRESYLVASDENQTSEADDRNNDFELPTAKSDLEDGIRAK